MRGEALPGFGVDLGVIGFGDLDGAIGRAGIDDDDFIGEADAGESSGEVEFLVKGDDGYGECWQNGHRFPFPA